MDGIIIRDVTPEDLYQLVELSRRTFVESFANLNTEENMQKYMAESFSASRLEKEIREEKSKFYFAEIEGKVIGYLKLNFGSAQTELKNENGIEIERIYVLKDYQGRQIGQLFYEKALEIGMSKKAGYIWLGVWEKNIRAIQFYKRNGFKEFDKHEFKLGDDVQTDVMMRVEVS